MAQLLDYQLWPGLDGLSARSHVALTAAARERWEQLEARSGLQGWALVEMGDSFGGGELLDYWHVYRHPDGRRAVVRSDGSCSDPELAALLSARVQERRQGPRLAWLPLMRPLAGLASFCLRLGRRAPARHSRRVIK